MGSLTWTRRRTTTRSVWGRGKGSKLQKITSNVASKSLFNQLLRSLRNWLRNQLATSDKLIAPICT